MSPNRPPVIEEQIPPGLNLLQTLRGHRGRIAEIAWSPDGKMLASSAEDGTVRLWEAQSGTLLRTLEARGVYVYGVAWSPDGKTLASSAEYGTVRLWEAQSGTLLRRLEGHAAYVYGVAWSPDGKTLASASMDGTVRLWEAQSGRLLRTLEGHAAYVLSVAWSPDGQMLASSAYNKTVRLWETQSGTLLRTLESRSTRNWSVAWSLDGKRLAVAGADNTVQIWNPVTGILLTMLEGHTDIVTSVRFSADSRLLASKGADTSLRLWRCDSWEQVAVVPEPGRGNPGGLAFHPHERKLATLGEDDQVIRIWELDYDVLLGKASSDARRYRNAKVVLVGDSGVGKTGLGLVLIGEKWEPTESTHGRHVWSFESRDQLLPDGREETREILLWDLAGQPGYRLIHQLHLNEVAVALVVFDARSETEPFSGVRHWDRALRLAQRLQAEAAVPLKKYLVAARADRGGIPVSRDRIETTVRELGFDGYFETSAREGWSIPELIAAIRDGIAWDGLPGVSSNQLFQTIKEFLIAEKEAGRLLSTADDLYRLFCQAHADLTNDKELSAKFETCVGRVENRGLIRRLSFGGYILLQPELLDAYASAMVNAARSEPDGLGCIAEEDALIGRFKMPTDERVLNKEQEKLVLIATVEELLRHEIVLKESAETETDLVFPSQFTRERPDLPDVPGRSIIFTFDGPVLNVYATLAVRLSRSLLFQKKEMWKNAASYRATVGGACGIYIRELDEGQGELTLFFDLTTSEATRYQFEDYVATHLQRRALPQTIKRRRIFVCAACETTISDEQSRRRRERGLTEMVCPVCDQKILLLDREERITAAVAAKTSEVVAEMDRVADESRNRETAAMILKGKIESGDYDVFLCHNSKDKTEVQAVGKRLMEKGILPWLDEWALRPGEPWQAALEKQIKEIKAAAVFVGPDGLGPWHDMEQQAFLRQFVKRRCPVIPVILPSCVNPPELPPFLEAMMWVDFRRLEPDPLEQLLWGITGERKRPAI